MNLFVIKNTFIKVYIYHFLINIFIEIRSQNCILETMTLYKMTSLRVQREYLLLACVEEL